MRVTDLIEQIGGGRVYEDLCKALCKVQMAVVKYNARGTVTLKFTIEPDITENRCPTCMFQADVDHKAPRPVRDPIRLYIGHEGQASTRHPSQPELRVPEDVPSDFADDKSAAAGQ